jgi:hypothetical protein
MLTFSYAISTPSNKQKVLKIVEKSLIVITAERCSSEGRRRMKKYTIYHYVEQF